MMKDLYHRESAVCSILAQTVGTTGTGRLGKIHDRQALSAEGLAFHINYGSITATNATFTVTLKEGDVTGTLTSVADADMIGTEAAAGIGATGTRVSGVSKNVCKKLGYIGAKRYVQLGIKSTVTAGAMLAANAIVEPASKPAA